MSPQRRSRSAHTQLHRPVPTAVPLAPEWDCLALGVCASALDSCPPPGRTSRARASVRTVGASEASDDQAREHAFAEASAIVTSAPLRSASGHCRTCPAPLSAILDEVRGAIANEGLAGLERLAKKYGIPVALLTVSLGELASPDEPPALQ